MLELYRHRRLVITLALLYLSQGIPIGLAMDALPTLLRQDGAPLQALAFLPLVGLPWSGQVPLGTLGRQSLVAPFRPAA